MFVICSFGRWWRINICMLLQIAGYFVQGLICLVYMPLCFQLARFTAEAASRVYCDLAQDIAAAQVPDIANANVPAVTRMFYSLPVSKLTCYALISGMLTCTERHGQVYANVMCLTCTCSACSAHEIKVAS